MAEKVQIEIEAVDAASGILRGITGQFGDMGRAGEELVNMFATQAHAADLAAQSITDVSVSADDVARANEIAQAATARFAEQLTVMAIKLGVDSVEAAVKYNEEIHKLSQMSGIGMEASSRLVQVLDDFGVEAEQLTPIIKAMTKEGLAPNIETMAMLSDKYLAIQDPVERNAFLFKNFGRAGDDLTKAMNAGGDAIKKMSDGVSENLLATNEAYAASEKYRLSLDNLKDTGYGLQVAFGNSVIPALDDIAKMLTVDIAGVQKFAGVLRGDTSFTDWAKSMGTVINDNMPGFIKGILDITNRNEIWTKSFREVKDATDDDAAAVAAANKAVADYDDKLKEVTETTTANTSAVELSAEELKAQEDAIKAVTQANTGLLSLTQSIQKANDDYSSSLAGLTQKQSEQNAAIAEAVQRFGENSQQVADLRDKYNETGDAIVELEAKQQEAMMSIAYDLLVAKLKSGEFTDAEYNMAITAGVAMGQIDEATASTAQNLNTLTSAALNAKDGAAILGDVLKEAMKDGVITSAELQAGLDKLNTATPKTEVDTLGSALVTAGDTGTAKIGEVQNSLTSFTSEHARDEAQSLNDKLNTTPNPVSALQTSFNNLTTDTANSQVQNFIDILNKIPDEIDVTIKQTYRNEGDPPSSALGSYGLPYEGEQTAKLGSPRQASNQVINIYGGTIVLGQDMDLGVSR